MVSVVSTVKSVAVSRQYSNKHRPHRKKPPTITATAEWRYRPALGQIWLAFEHVILRACCDARYMIRDQAIGGVGDGRAASRHCGSWCCCAVSGVDVFRGRPAALPYTTPSPTSIPRRGVCLVCSLHDSFNTHINSFKTTHKLASPWPLPIAPLRLLLASYGSLFSRRTRVHQRRPSVFSNGRFSEAGRCISGRFSRR